MAGVGTELARVPLFPLPGLVFLPGAPLPLHVFEPRYRAMVAHALDGDRRIAMACILEGHEGAHLGSPPLYDEVSVGRILEHRFFSDGRSHLLLGFVTAARIVQELPMKRPFREADLLAAPRTPWSGLPALQGARLLALQLASRHSGSWSLGDLSRIDGDALVDVLATIFLEEPGLRRRFLVASAPEERCSILEDALVERLAAGVPPASA